VQQSQTVQLAQLFRKAGYTGDVPAIEHGLLSWMAKCFNIEDNFLAATELKQYDEVLEESLYQQGISRDNPDLLLLPFEEFDDVSTLIDQNIQVVTSSKAKWLDIEQGTEVEARLQELAEERKMLQTQIQVSFLRQSYILRV
jgi:hypothetical protein